MSDRKYRQSGYQDDAKSERREPRPSGPKPRREGPRGRGLGAPTARVFRCSVCGCKQEAPAADAFAAACAQCATDLHTCTHCSHFDTAARFECREPIPERIRAKAKANRCELFTAKRAAEFAAEQPTPDDARSAFDALFKL